MKLPTEERFSISFQIPKFNLGQSKIDKILNMVLIGVIIGSFATLTYVTMKPRIGERFTEFYLLDLNGTASNYPTELNLGDSGELIVRIVNHESENIPYHIVVNFNDRQIYDYPVFLIDTEIWERSFIFQATEKGENQKLSFILFKDQEIFRTLNLWINIK